MPGFAGTFGAALSLLGAAAGAVAAFGGLALGRAISEQVDQGPGQANGAAGGAGYVGAVGATAAGAGAAATAAAGAAAGTGGLAGGSFLQPATRATAKISANSLMRSSRGRVSTRYTGPIV